jgi:hypothetical protein
MIENDSERLLTAFEIEQHHNTLANIRQITIDLDGALKAHPSSAISARQYCDALEYIEAQARNARQHLDSVKRRAAIAKAAS